MRQGSKMIEGRKRILAWMLAISMLLGIMPVVSMKTAAADSVQAATIELKVDQFGTADRSGNDEYVIDIKDALGLSDVNGYSDSTTPAIESVFKKSVYNHATGTIKLIIEKNEVKDATFTVETKKDGVVNGKLTLSVKKVDASEYITVTTTPTSATYGTPLSAFTPKGVYKNKFGLEMVPTITWKDTATSIPKNEKDGNTTNYKNNVNYNYEFPKTDVTGSGTYRIVINPVELTLVEKPTVADVNFDPLRTMDKIAIKAANPTAMMAGKSTAVPGKWEFETPNAIPNAGQRTEKVIYKPTDSLNYRAVSCYVVFNVNKITPKIQKVTASAIQLGQSLKDSSLIGDYGGLKGTIRWENESIVPTMADSNKTDYEWFFEPDDRVNYDIVKGKAKITIKKKAHPPVAIGDDETWNVSRDITYVREVGLPKDWKWNDDDAKKVIRSGGDVVVATAEYVGADKDNYENTKKIVKLEKSQTCNHGIITYVGGKASTCTEFGYQGKKMCKMCGAIVGHGEAIEPHGHAYVSTVVQRPTATSSGIRQYTCMYKCGSGYREVIASLSDNSAGTMVFKPALQDNVTTAAVIPGVGDMEIAAMGNISGTVTLDVQPTSGGVPQAAKTVKVTLTDEVKSSLETLGTSKLTIRTSNVEVDFEAAALKALKEKISGDVTVSIATPEKVGDRPAYDITLLKDDATKGEKVPVEDFESEGITIRIPYSRQTVDSTGAVSTNGDLEEFALIKGYYLNASGEKVYIKTSYFDSNRYEVVIPTTHFTVYGVGYKGGNPLGPKTVVQLASEAKKTSIKLSWAAVEGAKKYVVYGAKYGNSMKKLKTTTSSTIYTHKKLKKGTAYKYYVKVYLENGTVSSKTIYVYTSGGKYGNQSKVLVKPETITVKKGGSKNIRVTYKKTGRLKAFTSYVRYASSDTSVAKVSSAGKVTGVGTGECTIYIFTMNGYQGSVKVTVSE
ncbi:MAG: hypothetical protein E7280_05640 [Lachnospiraceae bacterium]|nr:hypothetical protein [Lachnospiraceae bacterium]